MTDTLWADISEFQKLPNNSYPYRWIAFRCNDGTYVDAHFRQTLAWAKQRRAAGHLDGFIVYTVYEPDGGAWARTLMVEVGTPDPFMSVMIDVESWRGRIRGDHSADINGGRATIAKWLHGNAKGVTGYGNEYDLKTLWPSRGDTRIILANYSANPPFPGKIAHQYTDHGAVAPFGFADMNSADGLSSAQLAQALGLTGTPTSVGTPTPVNVPAAPEEEDDTMAQNTGIYWDVNAKTVSYAVVNPESGYWQAFGNGAGNGPLPADYVNGVAAAFHTGSFAKVTAGHAAAIQASCKDVLDRKLTGTVTTVTA